MLVRVGTINCAIVRILRMHPSAMARIEISSSTTIKRIVDFMRFGDSWVSTQDFFTCTGTGIRDLSINQSFAHCGLFSSLKHKEAVVCALKM